MGVESRHEGVEVEWVGPPAGTGKNPGLGTKAPDCIILGEGAVWRAWAGMAVGVCGIRSNDADTSGENGWGLTGLVGGDGWDPLSEDGERALPDNKASIVKHFETSIVEIMFSVQK